MPQNNVAGTAMIITPRNKPVSFSSLRDLTNVPLSGDFRGLSSEHTIMALGDIEYLITVLQLLRADAMAQGDQEGVIQFATSKDMDEGRIRRIENVSTMFNSRDRVYWIKGVNKGDFCLTYSHLETVAVKWINDVSAASVRGTQFHVRLLNVARQYKLSSNRFRKFVSIIREIRVCILENPDNPAEISKEEQLWLDKSNLLTEAMDIAKGWFSEGIRVDNRLHVEIQHAEFKDNYGVIKIKTIGDIARQRVAEMGVMDGDAVEVDVTITRVKPSVPKDADDFDEDDVEEEGV